MTEQKRIAKNGIPLYSMTNEHSHGVYISMFLKSGVMYEGEDECGITHFLEHIAIRNVSALMGGELYRQLDEYGMDFNAATYNEMVQFYISGNSSTFRRGAEIISLLLSPISLPREELEAERSRIKAEIREADDRTSLATFTSSFVWENTTLARSITGTLGDVSRITAKRLEEYRRRVFTKENLFFYVTGNASDDDLSYLLELIGTYSLSDSADADERINDAPVPIGFGARTPEVRIKNADFTKIRYSFDVDMSRVSACELDVLYELVLGGYSSDFFVELSEKRGLFYDLGGAVEHYKNISQLYFTYELKASALYEATEKTMELLVRYSRELPRERCMRAAYVDNAYMLLDDSRDLNFTFGYDNHVLELGYRGIEDRRLAYAAITPERMREVAREVFRPENMTVAIKCNKKKTDIERLNSILFGRK